MFADGWNYVMSASGMSENLSPHGPRRLEDIILMYDAVDRATELFVTELRLLNHP